MLTMTAVMIFHSGPCRDRIDRCFPGKPIIRSGQAGCAGVSRRKLMRHFRILDYHGAVCPRIAGAGRFHRASDRTAGADDRSAWPRSAVAVTTTMARDRTGSARTVVDRSILAWHSAVVARDQAGSPVRHRRTTVRPFFLWPAPFMVFHWQSHHAAPLIIHRELDPAEFGTVLDCRPRFAASSALSGRDRGPRPGRHRRL